MEFVLTKIDDTRSEETLNFFDYTTNNFASFRLDELRIIMKTQIPENLKGTLLSFDSFQNK